MALTQALDYKVLIVAKPQKKNINLNLPPEIFDLYVKLRAGRGDRQHWMTVTAAILLLAESLPEVRVHFVAEIAKVDAGIGSYESLIERAITGKLREEAFKNAAPVDGPTISSTQKTPAPRRRGAAESAEGQGSRRR